MSQGMWVRLRRWFPKPMTGEGLDMRGEVRMLELIHHRLVLSVCALPLIGVPLTLWFQGLGRDPRGMLVWTLVYAMAALVLLLQRRLFRRDAAVTDAQDVQWLVIWRPIVRRMSLAHGVGLASLGLIVLLTPGHQAFDFVLLLHISLAAVIVGNAAFELPAVGVFLRLYAFGWGAATALSVLVWAYWPSLMPNGDGGSPIPAHASGPWPVIVPLSLLLLLALYRRAVIAHNFFVQQVQLEERSLGLAQDYRRATERAEQALRVKNQFLSTASHDLRQPAHAMGFLIESVAHRNRDPALVPALDDLRRSVRSMNLMFNALLDLSRIEGDGVAVRRVPVALDALMQEVATLFSAEARNCGLRLRVRPGGAAVVLADPVLLRQSLVNLTHNALRYTSRGGVLLAARRRAAHWRLEVWDSGMGIANEDMTQIYSPFYRHPSARSVDGAGHGLGLGLAVVARCADLMAAPYGLESIKGRGSRFWLLLPAANLPESAQAGQAGMAVPLQALSGRCLVVDDDPQVSAAWTSLMQAWGVEVRSAASAAEAVALLDAGFEPRAILCDQRLRGGESGVEVLKQLFCRCPEASGAMVSGEFASEALQQAEREGYLVLRKPLEVAQLHALLTQWLQPDTTLLR